MRTGSFPCVALLCALSAMFGGVAPGRALAQGDWPTKPVMIAPEALKTLGINTAAARSGAIAPHIDAQAYIAADERRISRIHPVGAGRVREVLVSPGQIVRRGEALLTYDDFSLSDEKQKLLGAQAALQQAEALEQDAALAWKRASALRGGVVSAGEAERRKARLADARAMVAQRRSMVQNETERMARFSSPTQRAQGIVSSVISPVDGVVLRINVTVGGDVSNATVAPVEVDDLSTVWIVSQVSEADAARLSVGDRQETRVATGRKAIESKVDLIEGGVDPGTRRVLVRSLVKNGDRSLRAGMLVRTRLFVAGTVTGQIVPSSALQMMGALPCVFVRTAPDSYEARHVEVGPSLNGEVVIASGLKTGDVVVTDGSFVMKSQALLNPPADAAASSQ
ncbi:efflux RND transporter periplasmic adaptor subunit [Acetobacter sacchari]|uniref:Efflux RND transporter periplasmic adaptor subunit n=1 Tax=Acetobacter sacchari TaxID=2661687 RepID=A0ABS3M0B4_9PROT|nr:efflux RND transporter periplasmic adaptor subunit [Acetobacter sacchari]MBO1361598.1 efflux RND transporter periplasmic adaptor subunit [Acetobacter sacchari]